MPGLTHVNKKGKIQMVDVSDKLVSRRIAIARSVVLLPDEVLKEFTSGDIITKKGSVTQTAIIAGIMAAKNTSGLIPLCHPIELNKCDIDIQLRENKFYIECTTSTDSKTGVEMEALVGASIAALTVYDMCKALSHDIEIQKTVLVKKSGGKNDFERK
jgi:cyclic pyranopterin phosphate synthase